MRQSGWCDIHTKKAALSLLQNTYPSAVIVRATYRSARKHYFIMIKNSFKMIISGAGT